MRDDNNQNADNMTNQNGNMVMGVRPRNDEDAQYFENDWRTNKGEEIHY